MSNSICANTSNSTGVSIVNSNASRPAEIFNEPSTIAINPDPSTQALKRGQYRITLHTDQSVDQAKQTLDTQVSVPLNNDFKRLHFYKIDYIPDGNGGTTIKAIVSVMDNQFIIGGIILAVGTIGGFLSGSLFVSKVEEFSQSVTGKLVEVGSLILTAFVIYYTLIKK